MDKYTSKMQCRITSTAFSGFGVKTKNSAKWCSKQNKGIPHKIIYMILLTLNFLVKLIIFPARCDLGN